MVCTTINRIVHDTLAEDREDEVWEASEVDTDGSECDSESDSEIPTPRGNPMPIYKAPSPTKTEPPPAVKVRTVPMPASQTSASPWQQESLKLAIHLRKDNERLRELLVQAQKQAEEAMEEVEKSQKEGKDVDFAHLLELVKEFGTGLEDYQAEETDASPTEGVFRLDDDDVDDRDTQIQMLQAQVEMLRAQSPQNAAIIANQQPNKVATGLPGRWVSKQDGKVHAVICPGSGQEPLDAVDFVWQVEEMEAVTDQPGLMVTLRGPDDQDHVCEWTRSRILGETLMWASGEVWTRQA